MLAGFGLLVFPFPHFLFLKLLHKNMKAEVGQVWGKKCICRARSREPSLEMLCRDPCMRHAQYLQGPQDFEFLSLALFPSLTFVNSNTELVSINLPNRAMIKKINIYFPAQVERRF